MISYDSNESIILGDNSESLLNIEREGELNIIVTISGLVDTREEVTKQEEEGGEKLQERFVSIFSHTLFNFKVWSNHTLGIQRKRSKSYVLTN